MPAPRSWLSRSPGRFPDTEDGLRRLPGIGPYTAAAIAAIAFGRKAAAVDGNVERVVSRLARIEEPLPEAKPAIRATTAALVPEERPGDFDPGADGSGGDDLHAAPPGLRPVSMDAAVPGARSGPAGELPEKAAEAGGAI